MEFRVKMMVYDETMTFVWYFKKKLFFDFFFWSGDHLGTLGIENQFVLIENSNFYDNRFCFDFVIDSWDLKTKKKRGIFYRRTPHHDFILIFKGTIGISKFWLSLRGRPSRGRPYRSSAQGRAAELYFSRKTRPWNSDGFTSRVKRAPPLRRPRISRAGSDILIEFAWATLSWNPLPLIRTGARRGAIFLEESAPLRRPRIPEREAKFWSSLRGQPFRGTPYLWSAQGRAAKNKDKAGKTSKNLGRPKKTVENRGKLEAAGPWDLGRGDPPCC